MSSKCACDDPDCEVWRGVGWMCTASSPAERAERAAMAESEYVHPPTPQLNKIAEVHRESQGIGRFLDWLREQGITLTVHREASGRLRDDDYTPEGHYPVGRSFHDLLAEYYQIDLQQADVERRAILNALRASRGEGPL